MDLKDKIFLFGGFYPENSEKVVKGIISCYEQNILNPEIYVNSGGGYISSLFAIKDTMDLYRKKGMTFTTVSVGDAQSAGALLLLSGDKRYAGKNTDIMIHGAQGGLFGNTEAFKAYTKKMEAMDEKLAKIVSAKTGITDDEARILLKDDRSFTADEAVRYGLIDGVWDVDETVSELSKYISENLAASAEPENNSEITELAKFVSSVKTDQIKNQKSKREDNMAGERNFELELQGKQAIIDENKNQIAQLTAKVTELEKTISNSKQYETDFYNKQKENLIAKSKGLVAKDKQEAFEAKVRKFIGLEYEAFEELTNDFLQPMLNSVPTGTDIDTTDDTKKLQAEKKALDGMTEEEKKVAKIINEGLEASSKGVDMKYAYSCVGIKGGK